MCVVSSTRYRSFVCHTSRMMKLLVFCIEQATLLDANASSQVPVLRLARRGRYTRFRLIGPCYRCLTLMPLLCRVVTHGAEAGIFFQFVSATLRPRLPVIAAPSFSHLTLVMQSHVLMLVVRIGRRLF